MKTTSRRIWPVVIMLALVLIPLATTDSYQVHLLNMIGIFAILAMGMNLAMGYCGQMNLAQGALYGVGAYTSALLSMKLGITFWITLPVAGLTAAAIGVIVGLPSMKVRSHYLAIVTIGLGQVIFLILTNWNSLTEGAIGLMGIPSPKLFGFTFDSENKYYYLILVISILLYLLAKWIVRSQIGRSFIAIRDDYIAARASGINSGYYQIVAFAMSAFYAGIAGSLYAHLVSYISPDSFQWAQTLTIMTMILIGGMGSLVGPILGVVILTIIGEYLQAFQNFQLVVYGLIVVLLVLFMPGGLLSVKERLSKSERFRKLKITSS